MTPDPDQWLDFAQRYTEAWCSQDPASVAKHYAPEGSLTINGGPPSVGRAAITKAARSFMIAFPDMRVLMDDLRVQDSGTRKVPTNKRCSPKSSRIRRQHARPIHLCHPRRQEIGCISAATSADGLLSGPAPWRQISRGG